MSDLLTLARGLATEINETFTDPEDLGLPAVFRYLPSLDQTQVESAPLVRVTLGALAVNTEEEDTCDVPVDLGVSVVFTKRLTTTGSLDDVADDVELDGCLDWIERLFRGLLTIEVPEFGRPKLAQFISPGNVDLFVLDWLRRHRVFCSVIGLTFEG